jgi:hypothetical protein
MSVRSPFFETPVFKFSFKNQLYPAFLSLIRRGSADTASARRLFQALWEKISRVEGGIFLGVVEKGLCKPLSSDEPAPVTNAVGILRSLKPRFFVDLFMNYNSP